MLFPLALALVTAAVLVVVVGPLLKDWRALPGRAEFDRAVYRDQLRELARDELRGLIGATEAKTARLEIERRLLAADRGGTAPTGAAPMPIVAALVALALAGGAGAVYLAIGSPGVPDLPYASRGTSLDTTADLAAAASTLEQRAAAAPNDVDNWLRLARAEAALQDWDKSASAYRRARALAPDRSDVADAYAEVLVMGADGIVTPEADGIFKGVVAKDPGDAMARYYLALADAEAGRSNEAIAAWQKLAAAAPAGAPIRAMLRQRIAEAAQAAGIATPPLAPPAAASPATASAEAGAPGPNAAQIAAAAKLTPEQRAAMVTSMVAQLAAKLKAAPNNLPGWLELARAYTVMGERDKAADAYDHAAKLDPKNPDLPRQEAAMLLAGQKLETPLAPRVVALLNRVEALAPNDPEALWYLGLAAAQAHDPAKAEAYWQRLLAALPADAPERETVTAALGALKGK